MHSILLTFDLEYWFESLSLQKYLIGNEKDSLANFIDRLLFLLGQRNIKATFFVTCRVLDQEPELIKKISQAGHEIAAHSIDHRPLWDKNAQEFEDEIKILQNKIKQIIGQRPIGHRAVNFSLNLQTAWVLKILAQNDFKYDSSILPYALKPNFYKFPKGQVNLTEVPVWSGGIYIRLIPWWLFKILLRNKLKKQPACLYLHAFDFLDPEDSGPDIKMPLFKKFIKYYNTKNTWQKLEYIAQNFKCVSIEEHLNNSNSR